MHCFSLTFLFKLFIRFLYSHEVITSNIRSSIQESLPPEYARTFAFDNFTRTQKHVLAKARDMEQASLDECIPAGSYARLHIRDVPFGVASKLSSIAKNRPVVACGLLQHESKISVLHFRYALWSGAPFSTFGIVAPCILALKHRRGLQCDIDRSTSGRREIKENMFVFPRLICPGSYW